MNPMLSHMSFETQVAPKRSNSGREILYLQNQRVIGTQHNVPDYLATSNPSVMSQAIPADVMDAFNRLRHYSYRELYHFLKLDRQHELKHTSMRASSIPEHRVANPRYSVASHASSGASSIFSNNPHRMSVASANTTYSHFSDPGIGHTGYPVPMQQTPHQSPGSEMGLNMTRKKSSASLMVNSPSRMQSNRSTLTAPLPRPSPRQSQSELEAKRKYFCTSCNKGFARKYDWKVHEQRYHEQQKQYPCPDCNVILHAETLFKSHHRDAHGCTDCVHAKQQEREVEDRRRRTAWGCGFCGEMLDEWEKRCDHVSAHYDEGVKRDSWDHSKVIVGLLKQEDIDECWRMLLIQKHGQLPNPPLAMRWSKEATGRSHGENSQQLQDLLEFGACPRDAALIAEMAYDLGLRTGIDTAPSPMRECSEGSTSSVIKSEPQTIESQDTMMASPSNITPELSYQPVDAVAKNELVDFTANQQHQQMHQQLHMQQIEHRTSSMLVTSAGMWPQYPGHSIPIHQHQYQPQPVDVPINTPYVDKALPPIPTEVPESGITLQLPVDVHGLPFENWAMPNYMDEAMLNSTTYPTQHYVS